MKSLGERWGKFLGVVLGPGSVLFAILAVTSLVVAFWQKDNTMFSVLLSVLASVFAGIAGNFVKDDYYKVIGDTVLEKKGRSALRNLESIQEQIVQIRRWIASFKGVGKEGKKALEETDRHLSTIMLNIVSGLADWVDVVPELQERAEVAKKQEEVLKTYIEELLENKKELIVSKDEKRVTELKNKIIDIEKQIKNLKKKSSSWSSASGGTYSGPTITASGIGYGGGSILESGTVQNCERCGNMFLSSGNGSVEQLCSDCRNGGVGFIGNSLV